MSIAVITIAAITAERLSKLSELQTLKTMSGTFNGFLSAPNLFRIFIAMESRVWIERVGLFTLEGEKLMSLLSHFGSKLSSN